MKDSSSKQSQSVALFSFNSVTFDSSMQSFIQKEFQTVFKVVEEDLVPLFLKNPQLSIGTHWILRFAFAFSLHRRGLYLLLFVPQHWKTY